MLDFRQIERDILSAGKVDGYLLEVLRQGLYADGKVNRRGADFLAELYKRVQHRTPAFERFFYEAIKDHVLTNGGVNPEETVWLRRLVFADGKLKDEERKFLNELRGEAKQACVEFEALYQEGVKQPQEQRSCG